MRSTKVIAVVAISGLVVAGSAIRASAQDDAVYTFEECDEGWKVVSSSSSDRPNQGEWHRAQPGNVSTSAFWNGPPYAGDDSEELLTSPPHVWKGGQVTLSYAVNYFYETSDTAVTTEGIHVEWSKNGRLWTELAWHGNGINPGWPFAFENQEVTFKAPKGKVFIRFRAISDALVEFGGGAVDDVSLNAPRPAAAEC